MAELQIEKAELRPLFYAILAEVLGEMKRLPFRMNGWLAATEGSLEAAQRKDSRRYDVAQILAATLKRRGSLSTPNGEEVRS
jgi:hypothetical protein